MVSCPGPCVLKGRKLELITLAHFESNWSKIQSQRMETLKFPSRSIGFNPNVASTLQENKYHLQSFDLLDRECCKVWLSCTGLNWIRQVWGGFQWAAMDSAFKTNPMPTCCISWRKTMLSTNTLLTRDCTQAAQSLQGCERVKLIGCFWLKTIKQNYNNTTSIERKKETYTIKLEKNGFSLTLTPSVCSLCPPETKKNLGLCLAQEFSCSLHVAHMTHCSPISRGVNCRKPCKIEHLRHSLPCSTQLRLDAFWAKPRKLIDQRSGCTKEIQD